MFKFFVFLLLFPVIAIGQTRLNKHRLLFFQLDNDVLFKTDHYYTNGFQIGYARCKKVNLPWQAFFWPQKENQEVFTSFSLKHNLYTPTNIDTEKVLDNDRPYASTLLLSHKEVIVDNEKHYQIANSITVGVLGKWALGKEIQNSMHKLMPPSWPALGWDNQLSLDAQFAYALSYMQGVYTNQGFHAGFQLGGNLGFPQSNATTALYFSLGNLHHICLQEQIFVDDLSYSLLGKFFCTLAAYDTSLRGGWFTSHNKHRVYRTYPFVVGLETEVLLHYKLYSLHLLFHFNSPDFKGAEVHRWGGLGFSFRY